MAIAKRYHYLYEWDRRRRKHGLILWIKRVGRISFARITREDGLCVLPEEYSLIPVKDLEFLYSDFLKTTNVDLQKYTYKLDMQPLELSDDSILHKLVKIIEKRRR